MTIGQIGQELNLNDGVRFFCVDYKRNNARIEEVIDLPGGGAELSHAVDSRVTYQLTLVSIGSTYDLSQSFIDLILTKLGLAEQYTPGGTVAATYFSVGWANQSIPSTFRVLTGSIPDEDQRLLPNAQIEAHLNIVCSA